MRFLFIVLCLILASPVLADPISPKPPEKKEPVEQKIEKKDVDIKQSEKLRLEALLQTVREYAFQKGFSDRYKKIQKECEERSRELDETYPFDQVLLQNGTVRPPVITRAEDSTTISDTTKMVRTGQAYRILRSAEFVSTPPSWRTYLILQDDALTPQEPVHQLQPRNSKEKKIWKEEYKKSYIEGMDNADMYFEEEMNRLNREFMGMIQYHILNRQGKISLPGISRGHYAVRISEDTMELDQRTFVITDKPRFQDKKYWRSGQ